MLLWIFYLKDAIPLGAEYDINPAATSINTMICGGCNKYLKLLCVWVNSKVKGGAGFLPAEIFSNEEDTQTIVE